MCDANDTHGVARRTVPTASTGWSSRSSWRWLWAAWGVWGRPEGRVSTCTPILDTLGPSLTAGGPRGGSAGKEVDFRREQLLTSE